MKKEEIYEEIQKIMLDYLGELTAKDMSIKSNLQADLGMDSLDILYVVFVIENKFEVRITDEEMLRFITVADMVNAVEAKKSN
jgi:acyl carrier protein